MMAFVRGRSAVLWVCPRPCKCHLRSDPLYCQGHRPQFTRQAIASIAKGRATDTTKCQKLESLMHAP